jgi:hypothetical protein
MAVDLSYFERLKAEHALPEKTAKEIGKQHYTLYVGFRRARADHTVSWQWPWQRKSIEAWSEYYLSPEIDNNSDVNPNFNTNFNPKNLLVARVTKLERHLNFITRWLLRWFGASEGLDKLRAYVVNKIMQQNPLAPAHAKLSPVSSVACGQALVTGVAASESVAISPQPHPGQVDEKSMHEQAPSSQDNARRLSISLLPAGSLDDPSFIDGYIEYLNAQYASLLNPQEELSQLSASKRQAIFVEQCEKVRGKLKQKVKVLKPAGNWLKKHIHKPTDPNIALYKAIRGRYERAKQEIDELKERLAWALVSAQEQEEGRQESNGISNALDTGKRKKPQHGPSRTRKVEILPSSIPEEPSLAVAVTGPTAHNQSASASASRGSVTATVVTAAPSAEAVNSQSPDTGLARALGLVKDEAGRATIQISFEAKASEADKRDKVKECYEADMKAFDTWEAKEVTALYTSVCLLKRSLLATELADIGNRVVEGGRCLKKLSARYHPDKFNTEPPSVREQANAYFKQLLEKREDFLAAWEKKKQAVQSKLGTNKKYGDIDKKIDELRRQMDIDRDEWKRSVEKRRQDIAEQNAKLDEHATKLDELGEKVAWLVEVVGQPPLTNNNAGVSKEIPEEKSHIEQLQLSSPVSPSQNERRSPAAKDMVVSPLVAKAGLFGGLRRSPDNNTLSQNTAAAVALSAPVSPTQSSRVRQGRERSLSV